MEIDEGGTECLKFGGLGLANWWIVRYLAKRFYGVWPLVGSMLRVGVLCCGKCGVYVGFWLGGGDGEKKKRCWIQKGFVEFVDLEGRVREVGGKVMGKGDLWGCRKGCYEGLFEEADLVPWSHVLLGTRLLDLNAWLDWEGGFGGEPVRFVKRLKEEWVVVRNERRELMRQGKMVIADVFCRGCGELLGWKCLKDLSDRAERGLLINYDQVGRFGIIRSAVCSSGIMKE